MKTDACILLGIIGGLVIGIAFSWADRIEADREHEREKAELATDLNAYRVMAEWEKFEDERP